MISLTYDNIDLRKMKGNVPNWQIVLLDGRISLVKLNYAVLDQFNSLLYKRFLIDLVIFSSTFLTLKLLGKFFTFSFNRYDGW